MTDGRKETIYASEGKDNLSKLDENLRKVINDAHVQAQLSKVK
jgi:hypothetical protein